MESLKSIPIIEAEEIEKYLDFQDLFNALENAFVNFSKGAEGGVIQPVRVVVPVDKYKA